ncbi:GntP family permease [Alienimonas californiensis]|uniref:GntP family permease n=1 Tax=Alienimonas californiensis TaxID=2527989 RepID=UPI0013FCFB4B|nr:SLC13 family permease [Alienimonas californiensis]
MSSVVPGLILLGSTAVLFLLIVRWNVHAFVALVAVAVGVAVASPEVAVADSVGAVTSALGEMAGKIAVAIVAASIVGHGLMASGAADRIVRALTPRVGRRGRSLPLVAGGFVLAIPVFFDTVFFLLVPLARAMSLRDLRGRPPDGERPDGVESPRRRSHFVLNALAISAGGSATHVFVPPTPGPLVMAAELGADLGVVMLVGTCVAFPASLTGWLYALWIDRRLDLPVRDTPGVDTASETTALRPDAELPPLGLALLPIALPVLLIGGKTVADVTGAPPEATATLAVVGDPAVALLIAAAASVALLARQRRAGMAELRGGIGTAVAAGGVIVLITAAGGAFGKMLVAAGLGEALESIGDTLGLPLLALGFGLASLFKIAQGSGTVAMITVSAVCSPLLLAAAPPFHAAWLVAAIGSGTLVGTWMNDSGFWVFRTMTGFDEVETLKTKSAMMALMGFAGFVTVLAGSALVPLV